MSSKTHDAEDQNARRRNPKRLRNSASYICNQHLNNHNTSLLQHQLELAIGTTGGVRRTLELFQRASDDEIRTLRDWSPLAGAIVVVGTKHTRREGLAKMSPTDLSLVMQLIQAFHDRGISVNIGSVHGEQYQRPLVVAAYYGFVTIVEKLLDLGATPDMADGEGRTALHAALQNPAGQKHVFRSCDRQLADWLVTRGCITPHLKTWRTATPKGSLIYLNGDDAYGSPLLHAIRNKNAHVVKWLVDQGACLTDRDYMVLRGKGNLLVNMVGKICTSGPDFDHQSSRERSIMNARKRKCWSKEVDWSFPPAWKVAVKLSQSCGLPQEIFYGSVVPFLARDWFLVPQQRDVNRDEARLGASMGQDKRHPIWRSVRWKGES